MRTLESSTVRARTPSGTPPGADRCAWATYERRSGMHSIAGCFLRAPHHLLARQAFSSSRPETAADPRSSWHDHTLSGLPFLSSLNRLHHPAEGKAMGYEILKRETSALKSEKFQCLGHMSVLASP